MIRIALGSALLLLVACSSADDGTPAVDSSPTTSTIQQSSEDGTATTTAASTTTTAASTTTVTYASIASDLGVELIEQLTAVSGGGFRPILEWSAVAGANRYYVVVSGPSGNVYWGWRTEETSVPVGGIPRLDEDAIGPEVAEGMTWMVTALDAEGQIIAISARRPIGP